MRPEKTAKEDKKQEYQDNTDRIEVERSFSLGRYYLLLWRLKIDNAYGVPDEYLVSYNYGNN
jgi:hypothetical protein